MTLSEQPPQHDFEQILGRLAEAEVDFVLIGGAAAIIRGVDRSTKDIDISASRSRPNLERLGSVLIGLNARLRGAPSDLPFVPDVDTLRRIDVLTLETGLGWLDILLAAAGCPPYEELRERAGTIDLDGIQIRVASTDDLIAMKATAGRPGDLEDIQMLEVARRLSERPDA